MRITDFLTTKTVSADLASKTKPQVIEELVGILIKAKLIQTKDKKKVLEVLMAREALGSTAIGQGIAIPHGKCNSVKKLIACLGISKEGINFESLDGEPAYIFFLLLAPVDSAGPHLTVLARVSRLLKDKFIRDGLRLVKDEKSIIKIIQQEDGRLPKM